MWHENAFVMGTPSVIARFPFQARGQLGGVFKFSWCCYTENTVEQAEKFLLKMTDVKHLESYMESFGLRPGFSDCNENAIIVITTHITRSDWPVT